MRDDGPSSEDLDRFGDDTAFCPDCGAEIWDQAEICPKCHAYIAGNTSSRPPIERGLQQRWMTIVVVLVLLGFLMIAGIGRWIL